MAASVETGTTLARRPHMTRTTLVVAGSLAMLSAACSGQVDRDRDDAAADEGSTGSWGDPTGGGPGDQGGGGPGEASSGAGGFAPRARIHRCLTVISGDVVRITLETGEVEDVASLSDAIDVSSLGSVALDAEAAYECASGTLTRYPLATGAPETSPVACFSAATLNGGILVSPEIASSTVTFYASFEAALAGLGDPQQLPEATYQQLAGEGDVVYAAWHADNELDRASLSTGFSLGAVTLEGYDTWIRGFDVTSDGLLVLNAHWPEGRIAVLDAVTGQALFDTPVEEHSSMEGLHCEAVDGE
jgi:hypothetical protein